MRDFASVTAPVKDGKPWLSPAQRKIIDAKFRQMEGKDVRITVSKAERPRSNPQNRFYWGCVLTMIAAETGHTTEELHEAFKAMLLPRCQVTVAGREVEIAKSTTDLSTGEMEDYLERVRAFAATELGMTIPLPNEAT
jgi:hypothetical protein